MGLSNTIYRLDLPYLEMLVRSKMTSSTFLHVLTLASVTLSPVSAQLADTFKYVGTSGASAQQMFLGRPGKVYIVDKTGQYRPLTLDILVQSYLTSLTIYAENNNITINGHPGWATEYDLATNEFRVMEVYSNSFCAGGTVLGNGTWLNAGGNQAVTYGGITPAGLSQTGQNPYGDADGGQAIRLLDPCDDENCDWVDNPAMYMSTQRWYPTLETLEDGSALIFGGCQLGGYVNLDSYNQNNPTVEVSARTGETIGLNLFVTVLAVSRSTLHLAIPPEYYAGQPLSPRLASAIRKHLHPSRIPSRDL